MKKNKLLLPEIAWRLHTHTHTIAHVMIYKNGQLYGYVYCMIPCIHILKTDRAKKGISGCV